LSRVTFEQRTYLGYLEQRIHAWQVAAWIGHFAVGGGDAGGLVGVVDGLTVGVAEGVGGAAEVKTRSLFPVAPSSPRIPIARTTYEVLGARGRRSWITALEIGDGRDITGFGGAVESGFGSLAGLPGVVAGGRASGKAAFDIVSAAGGPALVIGTLAESGGGPMTAKFAALMV
jgi:hypothetical protein